MKYFLLCALPALSAPAANNSTVSSGQPRQTPAAVVFKAPAELRFQDDGGKTRISAVQFKSQKFCRAELKDFDFDARFSILGANVYFSGNNFRGVEQGVITSAALAPVSALMERCKPGSLVVFDNIRVIGPDNLVRTIQGVSYLLY